MKKINLTLKSVLALIILAVFIAYWGSWNAFFQQDEWAGLGNFYSLQGLGATQLLRELYAPMFGQGLGHFLPWTPLVNYLRYTLFELNYPPYVLLSLALHVVASFLVFLLALRLVKDKVASLLAGAFFALASSGSQAVTWVGTSLPTQLAAIFSLLTIILWFDWLEKNDRRSLLTAVFSLILAIGFKETAVFLFIFLPAVGFLKRPELGKGLAFLFLAFAAVYAVLRIAVGGPGQAILLVNSAAQNFLTVSLRGTTQTLFPRELILKGTDKVVQFINPEGIPLKGEHAYDVFLQEEVIKPLMAIFGFVFILIYGWWARKKQRHFVVLSSLLLLLTAFVPLAFIPTGELKAVFLAPRGLYIPAIGASLLLGLTFADLFKARHIRIIVFSLFALFLGTHVFFLRGQIKELVGVGTERRVILTEVEEQYQDLPDRAIFYTSSNKAYFGLPPEENILPFQSGFGQTLLVWYYPTEHWPKEFLQNRFLWEITEQGYKEADDRGFGYFREFDLLKEAIDKYNIPPSSIIAFDWDSEKRVLTDITEEVRDELD